MLNIPKDLLPTMSNFHIHTRQSTCAQESMTIKNIVLEATKEGFKIIGLTDHFHELHRNFWKIAYLNRRELSV